jgi:signal peptidase I
MDIRTTAWDAPQGRRIRPDVVQGLFIRAAPHVHSAYPPRAELAHGAGEETNPSVITIANLRDVPRSLRRNPAYVRMNSPATTKAEKTMMMIARIDKPSLCRRLDGHSTLKMFYTGLSMYPTLRAGDVICIQPADSDDIRCGDVAVFLPNPDSQVVVHRIVKRTDDGFVSMGDNNDGPDSQLLLPDNIIGRVFLAENNGKARRINRGLRGQVEGFWKRLRRLTERKLCDALRPAYRFLAESGAFQGLGRLLFQTKVVMFKTQSGNSELQLIWKDRIIGRLASSEGRWIIKTRYRLLVDERKLPKISQSP